MQNIIRTAFIGFLLSLSYNANVNADFFGSNNDCPPWVYDCNDWPEWTPMYWMEEMSNDFDNNDDYWRYGGGPYGAPYGMPYGAPYGGPAPFGPPPVPYGAPAPFPGPYGAPAPYGRPPAPFGAPAPYGQPAAPFGAPQPPKAPAPQQGR